MHVLFIHPGFPAQFGHVAHYLATQLRWQCTFVSAVDTNLLSLPYARIQYRVSGDEAAGEFAHLGTFAGLQVHMDAIYRGLKKLPQVKPDLIVGHMAWGTLLTTRILHDCPFVGYFEWLPPPFWGNQLTQRPEFPPPEGVRINNATFSAFNLLQLHAVDAAYTPTQFQRQNAPPELQHKLTVIHDGIDMDQFQPRPRQRPVTFAGLTFDDDTRVVTYVSRGLESTRGFDIFMKAAQKIAREMSNVHFIIVGGDDHSYGTDLHHLPPNTTFKQWVLNQIDYDRGRFHFLGKIPITELVRLFNLTDLHIYLTVPFVLSWSMLQAMASGCTLVASATAPVQEVIDDGVHGLLADFYDVDGLASRALEVLRDPDRFRPLGQAARERVLERFEQGKCLRQLSRFFQACRRA